VDFGLILALGIALFFAMNIGGSGLSIAMEIPYGAGAISKNKAMILVALFVVLGAVLAGEGVIETVGFGIVPEEILDINIAIIILSSAAVCILITNIFGIPMSTSEVTVGALAGVGLYFTLVVGRSQSLNVLTIAEIAGFWFFLPALSFVIAYIIRRFLYQRIIGWLTKMELEERIKRALDTMLITSGCYVAFSIGANNTSNAIGPLVGAGAIELVSGALFGGLFIGVGALIFGRRVLETTGKKIAEVCTLEAALAAFISGTLVILASFLGIPVPLAQVVPTAIMGIGCGQEGQYTDNPNSEIWQKMVRVWLISPVVALTISFSLMYFYGYYGGQV